MKLSNSRSENKRHGIIVDIRPSVIPEDFLKFLLEIGGVHVSIGPKCGITEGASVPAILKNF